MPSRWTGPSAAKWFSATATTPSLSAPKTRDIDPRNAECHDGRISVGFDAGTWELSTLLLANDRAIDEGDSLHITSVETGSTMGSVAFDAARDLLSYAASNQVAFAEGEHGTDRFTYSIATGMAASAPRPSPWTSSAPTMRWCWTPMPRVLTA